MVTSVLGCFYASQTAFQEPLGPADGQDDAQDDLQEGDGPWSSAAR